MSYDNFVAHTCRSQTIEALVAKDVTRAMKMEIDRLAVNDLALLAEEIWMAVSELFYSPASTAAVLGLGRDQVKRRVYRARQQHCGGSSIAQIQSGKLAMVKGEDLFFFQFSTATLRTTAGLLTPNWSSSLAGPIRL